MIKLVGYVGAAILSVSMLAVAPVQAHGGGIDWQGGHNCNVGSCAGTYHCHQPRAGICANNGNSRPNQTPNTSSAQRTCVTEVSEPERCVQGRTWTSDYCWDIGSVSGQVNLEKKQGLSWKSVQSNVARKDLGNCEIDYPWSIDLSVRESRVGTYDYRLKFPDGDSYSFRVKVT
jgi:hypothetical protein